ncbi:TolC family protein [Flammeovirga sp. EKP202]|uniref:TolC family protein n=1 Tax=Flammeovirga sp. EKP202 TaxID=2770592 RepID=UPI00165F53E2|nr:TolC family protein [Flammeovirga sp. EKP202]MBD0404117.1 TolC family protein [Flammeovirga sp. EKP202]
MQKKLVFVLCGCLLSFGVFAQSNGIDGILQSVEYNNKELQAYLKYIDSKKLELKSNNNLPDPQVETYYLPFGQHSTGSYSEFQVSQTLEFPTVYGARNKLIDGKQQTLQFQYEERRQEILVQAQNQCLELIYLDKQKSVEQDRLARSKKVYEQAEELFKKEEKSALEFNKAKIAWMQQQFKVQDIESDRQNLLLSLKNLNGNIDVNWNLSGYATDAIIVGKDNLWQEKLAKDPKLQQVQQQEVLAQQTLSLAKNQSLPDLSLGYNYQGFKGENYSGIYAGISIPLWNNKNKVKSAQSNLQYQTVNTQSATAIIQVEFEKQYNEYELLLLKYTEYQNTLSALSSDVLLLKAYENGELSFMEYYIELNFYNQAYDTMLQMEAQLQQRKSELLKHQL